jgi:H+-transporting ATPase
MTPTADKPEAKSESKAETKPETKPGAPGAKSNAQKNLKSIPMEELQKKLGSSPNGLSEGENTAD